MRDRFGHFGGAQEHRGASRLDGGLRVDAHLTPHPDDLRVLGNMCGSVEQLSENVVWRARPFPGNAGQFRETVALLEADVNQFAGTSDRPQFCGIGPGLGGTKPNAGRTEPRSGRTSSGFGPNAVEPGQNLTGLVGGIPRAHTCLRPTLGVRWLGAGCPMGATGGMRIENPRDTNWCSWRVGGGGGGRTTGRARTMLSPSSNTVARSGGFSWRLSRKAVCKHLGRAASSVPGYSFRPSM